MLRDENTRKSFVILTFFLVLSCLIFWSTSRYPALSEKAVLSDSPILSNIGFFPIFEIHDHDSFWTKVFKETGNWINTNKKGMTFSFIIGSFLLCLLPMLQKRKFKNGFKNSFLGLVIGAPLGICVNCAAPVARSLYGAGSSMQTSLATLIASPTLNVIVLTMALSLFPFYLVVCKVIITLVFILIFIPLACRFFFEKEIRDHEASAVCSLTIEDDESGDLTSSQSWFSAFIWSFQNYIKNFLYLLKIALPLMLLSGFLGSLLTIVAPWSYVEEIGTYSEVSIITYMMFIIAFLGALLPAPMAFDVILSSVLLQAGVPIQYVSVMFFTLGSFSIYAFFIVWQSMSFRVASFLLFTTVILGMLIGYISMALEAKALKVAKESIVFNKSHHDYDPIVPRDDLAYEYDHIREEINQYQTEFRKVDIALPEHLSLKMMPYIKSDVNLGVGENFSFVHGDDVGIYQPYEISYITGIDSALAHTTLSIATGDVHKDGWPDILLTGDIEVSPNLILYANIAGQKYIRQKVPLPDGVQEITLVALVDLNGDGWLDIVFSAYGGKSFVIYNQDGAFLSDNIHPLYPENKGTTMSMAFGDIERDGDLDIVFGNWSGGPFYSNFSESQNILLKNQGGGDYVSRKLGGSTGETLTTLLYDINQDGYMDLFTGNDYVHALYSDIILTGDKDGELNLQTGTDINKIYGGHSTMSIDVGDIDNDLKPDFYIAQIAFLGHYEDRMHALSEKQILHTQYCDRNKYIDPVTCERETQLKYAIAASVNISDACTWLEYEVDRHKCFIHQVNYKEYCRFHVDVDMPKDARKYKIASQRYREFCDKQDQAGDERALAMNNKAGSINPSRKYHLRASNWSLHNTLLHNQSNANVLKFEDLGVEREVGYGAWSWNARFGDMNNDGWQDIYLVNGHGFLMSLATNIFYLNQGHGHFEDKTKDYGLENFTVTTAFSFVDFDNDGDLDIINAPLDAPIQIYRNNNLDEYSSIQFELRDDTVPNSYAMGAEIIIYYTYQGKPMKQMGVLKASGGSKSYNQPIIHFGLENATTIDEVIIKWPNGDTDKILSNLQANHRYRIEKNNKE